MRICIVGASGKLGKYMVQHALDRGYEVVGVCRVLRDVAGREGSFSDYVRIRKPRRSWRLGHVSGAARIGVAAACRAASPRCR